jgi:hypothetical protein
MILSLCKAGPIGHLRCGGRDRYFDGSHVPCGIQTVDIPFEKVDHIAGGY